MSSRFFAVVGLVASVAGLGCNDAVIVAVASDRPVPQAIDAICVGVADVVPSGGRFGRRYALEGRLGSLPQTLRVESGNADEAWAWVRGDRAGVPVARAGARVDFAGDVTLGLDRCAPGSDGAPAVVGGAAGPADARLVASSGAGGDLVVALGATAVILDVGDGALVANPTPAFAGTILDAIAADVDGDCDDDLVIVTTGGPPIVWIRDGVTFAEGTAIGDAAVSAIAAADVDRDGDIDLVTGDGGTLTLWRNDGSGAFADDPAALAGEGRVQSIRALALGDLDEDGNPDLVVGQAGGEFLRTWSGESGGTGSFLPSDAISEIPADVVRMQLADLDGDFDPDLVVAIAGAPLKVFLTRATLLEDRTFNTLGVAPTATAIAIGGWDLGCEPDLVIAGATTTETRRGLPGGALEVDGMAPAATDVVMVDIDDDGVLDAVIATAEGARWLAR